MKLTVTIAFVAFFAVASSKHIGINNKNLMTDIIQQRIENNRDKMANLTIAEKDLNEFGKVTNLTVVGLEKFVLELFDAAGPLTIDIKNATITLATASATADIDLVNVQVPEIGLTVNGKGSLSGSADNLFVTVSLDLSLDGLKPHLENFTNLYISIGQLNAALVGIDNADATNEIINASLKDFLNSNLAVIAEENKPAIIEAINKILDGTTY